MGVEVQGDRFRYFVKLLFNLVIPPINTIYFSKTSQNLDIHRCGRAFRFILNAAGFRIIFAASHTQ
jgi:hypothetical protein